MTDGSIAWNEVKQVNRQSTKGETIITSKNSSTRVKVLRQNCFIRGRGERRENSFGRSRVGLLGIEETTRAKARTTTNPPLSSSWSIYEAFDEPVKEPLDIALLQLAQEMEPIRREEPDHIKQRYLIYYEEGVEKPVLQTNLTFFFLM